MPSVYILPAGRTCGLFGEDVFQKLLSLGSSLQMEEEQSTIVGCDSMVETVRRWGIDDVHSKGVPRSQLHFFFELPMCSDGINLQGLFLQEGRRHEDAPQASQHDVDFVFHRSVDNWAELGKVLKRRVCDWV